MIPNAQLALERSKMTVEICSLSAKGHALLLQSVAAEAPEEVSRLHQEAVGYLDKADQIRDDFVARFPNSLNVAALG